MSNIFDQAYIYFDSQTRVMFILKIDRDCLCKSDLPLKREEPLKNFCSEWLLLLGQHLQQLLPLLWWTNCHNPH